uniref:Cell cycle progression 1 n=1 Tax=Pan troglodytes TaxID=9598 RepID=K7DTZ0_PANTR
MVISFAETVYLSDSWENTNIHGVVGKAKDKSGAWYLENPKAISSKRNKCVMLFKKLMCGKCFLGLETGRPGDDSMDFQ